MVFTFRHGAGKNYSRMFEDLRQDQWKEYDVSRMLI